MKHSLTGDCRGGSYGHFEVRTLCLRVPQTHRSHAPCLHGACSLTGKGSTSLGVPSPTMSPLGCAIVYKLHGKETKKREKKHVLEFLVLLWSPPECSGSRRTVVLLCFNSFVCVSRR